MIEICNDKPSKLHPLEYILNKITKLNPLDYILNNDVEINIKYYNKFNKEKKEIDDIINYLNYYGIAYDIDTSINDIFFVILNNGYPLFGFTRTLNITKDDLEVLDKDLLINLLNSILDIAKNSDFIKLEIKHYK